MLPAELARQIKLLEIRTCRIVDEVTGGAYRSAFKGSGIEFDEVREYTQEDDVRDIDWNVSARMGTPYVKKFSSWYPQPGQKVRRCAAAGPRPPVYRKCRIHRSRPPMPSGHPSRSGDHN